MFFMPVKYNEPLFRPPAEAYSAIIQLTLGCSYNKCAFCEMYKSKKFAVRSFEDVKKDIAALSDYYSGVKKVFLADGDAMVLSASKLLPVLEEINSRFGRLQRISSYALPSNILSKTADELKLLRKSGLKLIYVGIESGDDDLLRLVNKGETYKSTVDGIKKAHDAGIETSVMILNGLGGKKYSVNHAVNSAKLINEINPKFLSTLTLSFPFGESHYVNNFAGEYQQQTVVELMAELKLFISSLDVKNVIFRSNHVSNNLNLAGVLSADKEKMIKIIDEKIANTPLDSFPDSSDIL